MKSSANETPAAFSGFVLKYLEAGADERKALAATMKERASHIMDGTLRKKTIEAVDELVDADSSFGEHRDLLDEFTKKLASTVAAESIEATSRAGGKQEAFAEAVRVVDELEGEEKRAMREFQTQTEQKERIARGNLSYFKENGFAAFGLDFESFLAILNRNMLSVYPQADGEIVLPKEFSERDRALLANGLVRSIGGDAKVEDYFEIPGYRLRQTNGSGPVTTKSIRSELERSGIIKDGSFRQNRLESAFAGAGKDATAK